MTGTWTTIARAAACVALFVSAACADHDSPIAPPADVPPQAVVVDGTGKTFELLQGVFPNPQGNGQTCDATGKFDPTPARLRSAAWIGPLGGVITLSGGSLANGKVLAYVLTVPPLAVKKSTLFCIRLEPTNHMQVRLQAHALDTKGNVVNVGASGFTLPVTLTMPYASLNLSGLLEPRVVVLYDPENGKPYQTMPSVSMLLLDVVVATLPHFSKYAMAVD